MQFGFILVVSASLASVTYAAVRDALNSSLTIAASSLEPRRSD
jgi:hypothetical protein